VLNRVLFSPVGSTDPVRDGFDGPMLHILRYFNPRKVYLYLTSEMLKREKELGVYSYFIKKLSPECEIERIETQITDPSDYNVFLNDFPRVLKEVRKKEPGAEILVNITSGTTQMQAALCLEITDSSKDIIPVQVITPEKRPNENKRHEEFKKPEDLERLWDNLLDNLPEAENRCRVVDLLHFKRSGLKSQISAFTDNYDYRAARAIYSGSEYLLNAKVGELLEFAFLRSELKTNELINSGAYEKYRKELYMASQPAAVRHLEYVLEMKITQKRGELKNHILRITPILTSLITYYVMECLGYDLKRICTLDKDGNLKEISREKLEKNDIELLEYLDGEYSSFSNRYVSLDNMVRVLTFLADKKFKNVNRNVLDKFKELREIEKEIRNKLAHRLENIDEQQIKEQCGVTTRRIQSDIEWLLKQIFVSQIPENAFESYDKLNSMIKEALDLPSDQAY